MRREPIVHAIGRNGPQTPGLFLQLVPTVFILSNPVCTADDQARSSLSLTARATPSLTELLLGPRSLLHSLISEMSYAALDAAILACKQHAPNSTAVRSWAPQL